MSDFLKDLLERTIATVAETLLGYVTVAETIGEINWQVALGACAVAALVTVLKAIIKEYKDEHSESDENWEEDDD